jgi:predicted glycogen debranching enzyme
MRRITQTPLPDTHRIRYRGDTAVFTLDLGEECQGDAWLRTNIGRGHIRNEEIIRFAEEGLPPLSRDWHDLPMKAAGPGRFRIVLPLLEVGRFEAKAFFAPKNQSVMWWPEGGNAILKVEPAETAASNTMYTAFVRQFGPDKGKCKTDDPHALAAAELDAAGFEVIPRSGKFRELSAELEFITKKLRCRIVQLLPIFPTPTTFARMGRFGSPFAAMDLFDVDPALAIFDKQTTPLEQFRELVDEVHRLDARLFIDLPINHTGWASALQIHHPEWFERSEDDTFVSPGAWGIVWGDLSKLDYRHRELWQYMAEVFLFWCRCGVDGFRLDAGYKIPFEVWRYIVARVRNQYPDTVFMLEGLGGDPKITERLLSDSGIDWAYSELFQNYSREQIESYLPEANRLSTDAGTLIHFSETHDNNRLAAKSKVFAKLRSAVCALASDTGAFGFTNGVEWYAEEKISVHGNPPLCWGSEPNMVDFIARLLAILEVHPSYHSGGRSEFIHTAVCDSVDNLVETSVHNSIAMFRTDTDGAHPLLIVANLDDEKEQLVCWKTLLLKAPVDLILGKRVKLDRVGDTQQLRLSQGEVLALTDEKKFLVQVERAVKSPPSFARSRMQVAAAEALEVYQAVRREEQSIDEDIDPSSMATSMAADPARYLDECAKTSAPRSVRWRWPVDARRTVMVPPDHFIYVSAPVAFILTIEKDNAAVRFQRSLRRPNGTFFALVKPFEIPTEHKGLLMRMTVFEPDRVRRAEASLLLLSESKDATVACTHTIEGFDEASRYAILTNEIGAMSQVREAWAKVKSKYDALLAANLNPRCPEDRRIMLTRMRAWIVCRGYSFELGMDGEKRFSLSDDDSIVWRFSVPGGHGLLVAVKIVLKLDPKQNRITVDFHRLPSDGRSYRRADEVLAEIIVRPDIEDRISHHLTKAYAGPETLWQRQITPYTDGFTFSPSNDRHLHVVASRGGFTDEKEWKYQVHHHEDEERGMDPLGDLFSPGYFRIKLMGGERATIAAEVSSFFDKPAPPKEPKEIPQKKFPTMSVKDAAARAQSAFIVNRDAYKTVIAGYPWFLDWGRDTLIALRGIIAAGRFEDARAILLEFAKFEQNGTLPNMIRGEDHSNRDTSDAPLFFFVAVSDLMSVEGNSSFLEIDAGGRTIREVLLSIARSYIQGTPNGIQMDAASGLVFSPSHFTWMDTNYPQGTPREGYPVEIQALWIHALKMSARLDRKAGFQSLAEQATRSLHRLFVIKEGEDEYLADCLSATRGQSANAAVQDDALRPNQLLALTLGAVLNHKLCKSILAALDELLVPGGIRSLADRKVRCLRPIFWDNRLLNVPDRPYIGRYIGDEDTSRKPAYHNGTAWTWLFPSYCEAVFSTYGESARRAALSLLSSSSVLMNQGCLLHVPEVLDGDTPHTERGCGAQAWGASELYRVWKKIEES